MNSIDVSGKTVEQAIEIGLYKLNTTRENVKIIVLDEGGLFDKAKVKLILKSAYENQTQTERIVNGRIMYEGEIDIIFIFSSNNTSGINTRRYILPFNFEQEIEGLISDKTVNSNVNCVSDVFNWYGVFSYWF